MMKFSLIFLLSFALVLSTHFGVGHGRKIKEFIKKELGSAGDAPEEPTSLLDVEEFSYNELKKIGTEIKEAFQKMESVFNGALSPEREDKGSSEDDEELAPSGEMYGGAPSSDDNEELVPSSWDGDALPTEDGEELVPSSREKVAPLLVDGEEAASSPENDE
ncbi:hypothetical protein V6N13_065509 [Hibiscus sabdariffa]|uniref:Uncharacterized protein n=1 Tax=Hibiscus sabdariffa TaxID=183260 RepID=A0ABR2QQM9_9ROSI